MSIDKSTLNSRDKPSYIQYELHSLFISFVKLLIRVVRQRLGGLIKVQVPPAGDCESCVL